MFRTYLILLGLLDSIVYAQKSVELTPDEREKIFPYECFLPDGRRYRSTIPCPSYDDNGQVIPRVARASQGNGNVCANGGSFAGTYCLGDYNCNENRLNSNAECIRAMCCTRTNSPKASVNVRNNNDIQLCPNGGYSMSRQCTQNADCNVGDTGRAARGYSIQKCVQSRSNGATSNCCSKQYLQPSRRGDRCLNGGIYTGQNCVNDDDCQAASSRLNRGRRRQITNRGGNRAAACVERVCCTAKRYPNNYNGDDYEYDTGDSDRTDGDDSSALDEDHSVCRNGGAVVADEDGEIVYCQSHAECGGLVDGRWNAICSGGRCCYNTGTLGGRHGADYQRGQDMCNTLAPAPGTYTGYKCDTPSDCGDYHDYDDTYSCIGGYCCEEDFDLVSGDGIVPGVTQRDRVCNNRGFFLGNSCIGSRECRRSRTRGRVNLCINRSCCSVPTRQRDYGSGFADYNSVCPRAPFRYYLGETCRRQSDCPVLAGPNRRRQQVRCHRGFCCGVGTTPLGYGTMGNGVGGVVGPYLGRDTTYFPARLPGSIALCYDGSLSSRECHRASECGPNQSCVNHLCCEKNQEERKYVCAGLGANGDCFANEQCPNNLHCTPSKLCCECEFGQPQLGVADCRQGAGACRNGYACSPGGFCCPQCPSGEDPYGSCAGGKCAVGYGCQQGNICCRTSASALVNPDWRSRLAFDPYYNQNIG